MLIPKNRQHCRETKYPDKFKKPKCLISVRIFLLFSYVGSQYTSKAFTKFCEKNSITRSMIKTGYLYDNAPTECYFNALKNREIYLHHYPNKQEPYD